MKKTKIAFLAAACCLLCSPAAAEEVTRITSIYSAADLAALAAQVNGKTDYTGVTVTLETDISLSAYDWTPIGLNLTGCEFQGTFDGGGHTISNLSVDANAFSTGFVAGLFGYIGAAGVVKDLTVSSIEVRVDKDGRDYTTCYVGSIAGYNAGTIVGCANRGVTVYGNVSYACVGGIAGENAGSIQNCYNLGRVYTSSSSGNYLGGIVGENASAGTVQNCFVRASIDDGNKATDGPVCGNNQAAAANISGCFYMNGSSTDNYVNLSLQNSSSNDISSYNNQTKNVLLQGRTIYSDGAWNTFCVPFSIPAGASGYSPIAGATVKELDPASSNFNPSTGVLTLNFTDATTVQAGRPYIIKWDQAIADDLSNPVFLGVTVQDKSEPERAVTTNDGYVTFQGIFDPFSTVGADRSVLYLGSANKLYYPSKSITIGSCRAYFQLKDPSPVRACILDFDDSMTTTIHAVPSTLHAEAGTWFSPDGRRLSGKPTRRGVYICNGRKVVVK